MLKPNFWENVGLCVTILWGMRKSGLPAAQLLAEAALFCYSKAAFYDLNNDQLGYAIEEYVNLLLDTKE